MSQYKNGTVSVTNGSNVVTGTGTAWQTAGIDSSNIFTKEGDNVAYSIASVDSDTQLTLTANYGGSTSSGSNYGIVIDFTPSGYPLLSSGDLNTDAIYNDFVLSVDNLTGSLGNAAFVEDYHQYGLGETDVSDKNADAVPETQLFRDTTGGFSAFFDDDAYALHISRLDGANGAQIAVKESNATSLTRLAFRHRTSSGVWSDIAEVWSTENTTVDVNGFIKEL